MRKSGEKGHIARHPQVALKNATDLFKINQIEKDIILNHMWPFTLSMPKYKETYVIVLVDKYCAIMDFAPYISKLKRKIHLIRLKQQHWLNKTGLLLFIIACFG